MLRSTGKPLARIQLNYANAPSTPGKHRASEGAVWFGEAMRSASGSSLYLRERLAQPVPRARDPELKLRYT